MNLSMNLSELNARRLALAAETAKLNAEFETARTTAIADLESKIAESEASLRTLREQLAALKPPTKTIKTAEGNRRKIADETATLRAAILATIANGTTATGDIAKAHSLTDSSAWYQLSGMVASGMIVSTARGQYAVAPSVPSAPPADAPKVDSPDGAAVAV